MMKKILSLIFILMIGMAASAFAEESVAPIIPASNKNSDQKFEGFNLQGYSENGQKAWDVNGDTADIQGSEIKINKVVGNRYGEQKMNVTADTGYVNQQSGSMRLEKDVVIKSDNGATMTTDSLNWDRNKDLVTTEDPVKITYQNNVVTGTGMEAHPGLKNATIQEDVTMTVEPEFEQPTGDLVTISCDGPMVLDQGKGMATFEINVVAEQKSQKRILKADRMEVYFNQDSQTIKEMICIGNVEILYGENRSYAQKAHYTAADGKLILMGRPKIVMQADGLNNGSSTP